MNVIAFIVIFIFLMFIGIPIMMCGYYMLKEGIKEKKEIKILVREIKKLPSVHEMNGMQAKMALNILDEYFELPNTLFHEPIMDYYRNNKKRLLKLAKK